MKQSLQDNIVGNRPALKFIEDLAFLGRRDYLSGGYIFAGYDQETNLRVAHWLFAGLACLDKNAWPCGECANCHQLAGGIFPDLYRVALVEGKQNIGIDQIKDMIGRLSLSSFSNNYRFVLIENAETLSLSAANSLLKTLEEPGVRIIIVLSATDISSLPATIVSRSQIIHFRPVAFELLFNHLLKQGGLSRNMSKAIARLAMGRFGLAERFQRDQDEYRRRLTLAQSFMAVMDADVGTRLQYCQKLTDKKEAKDRSLYQEIIFIWQTVIRDLLLMNLNQPDLIHNDGLRDVLNDYRARFDIKRLVNAGKALDQAKMYLSANVNVAMTLENVLLNI